MISQNVFHSIYLRLNFSQKYDHLEFPGVVPRTFLGPLFISVFAFPFKIFLTFWRVNKFYCQILVRSMLSLLCVCSFKLFRLEISAKFGTWTSAAFVLVTCSQFHLPYYLSRTLPNTFAVPLVLLAFTFWLQERYTKMIFIFTFTILVFRSELILLFAPLMLDILIRRRITLRWTIFCGVMAVFLSMRTLIFPLSIFCNSFFMQFFSKSCHCFSRQFLLEEVAMARRRAALLQCDPKQIARVWSFSFLLVLCCGDPQTFNGESLPRSDRHLL